jgi:hypothetical protein
MKCVAATGQNSFSTAMLKLAKTINKSSSASNACFGIENMIMTELQFIKKMSGSK